MCWNKEISLNTFVFSIFVLLLIMYNNAYTQYKIVELNSIWVYLFLMSFIFMQLIEYFIWKNVNNAWYNSILTILATFLLLVQPIATTMLINNKNMRNILLKSYLIVIIPLVIYKFATKKINSGVSELGHLKWNTVISHDSIIDIIYLLIWFLFFLFPLFYEGYNFGLFFGVSSLLIIAYNYINDGSSGSMWCWIVNSIMIYYASYLLLYLPFKNS